MTSGRGCYFLSVIALCLSPAWVGAATTAPPVVSPILLPHGITCEDGALGFLVNRKGAIDAVNLATGEVLWSTDFAARPLVAFEKRLAVEVLDGQKPNVLRVAVLDATRKGKRLLLSDPITFPGWVALQLAYGRSFTSSARIHKGELLLSWEAHAFNDGNSQRAETKQAIRRDASGLARVDLQSGAVRMTDPEPPAEGLVKVHRELTRKKAPNYWNGRDWAIDPLIVADTLVRPWWEQADDGRLRVRLKRWDLATGESRDSVDLFRGTKLRPAVTLDGQHLLVHSPPTQPSPTLPSPRGGGGLGG
ncbi:MAG TPA: hypothetical protein VKD72_00875, partial [Gemmataceae bacterium]|nr:hypothetical protein [Gemmataceae bacterium]